MRPRPDRRPFGPGPCVRAAGLRNAPPTGSPFELAAVRALPDLRFDAPVTFLVGENESGKSTLIEGLASALRSTPRVGRRGSRWACAASVTGWARS